jgi:hypothetical protein
MVFFFLAIDSLPYRGRIGLGDKGHITAIPFYPASVAGVEMAKNTTLIKSVFSVDFDKNAVIRPKNRPDISYAVIMDVIH